MPDLNVVMQTRFVSLYLVVCGLFVLSGCARGCESMNRKFQMTKQTYTIRFYSGGKLVEQWTNIRTMVNSSKSSDGYYFRDTEGRLIEVSGDVVIICESC